MADLSLVSDSIPEVMKIKSAFDPVELSRQKEQLQRRMTHVKTSYVFLTAKKQFMDSLYTDPPQWPSMGAAGEALQEATDELDAVKEEMSTIKTTMESLCESAQEGIAMLVDKRKLLIEKQKELLEKKSILERHKSKGFMSNSKEHEEETRTELLKGIDVATAAILKCNCAIDRLESEISRQDLVVARLEETEVRNAYHLRDINSDQGRWKKEFAQLAERLRQLTKNIERLGGVTVTPVGWSTLRVEFPTSSSKVSSVQLSLLLDFSVNNIGHLILKSAKENGCIDASDLLRQAVADNDVPALVTKLKSQWRSYQPLITEISHLQQRSAVDWIQDEGLLRVMVGQCGTVVCTLVIPPSYPQSGEVTLADIKGQSDDNIDITPSGHDKTLTRWVDFLETKFGRP